MKGMVGSDERLLAVQDGWISRGPVVALAQPEGLQVNGQGMGEGGMWVGFELRVRQVGDYGFGGVELDEVGLLDPADVAPGAPFIEPQKRWQAVQGALVHVDGRGGHLADR